jgi:prepilin-type N-terminal cleavage/methylation domain-containing protein
MNANIVRQQAGFTLMELLVVVAIIGILTAIAIPQVASYRRRGIDSQIKADIRNVMTAQEAYFVDMRTYTSSLPDLSGTRGYRQSDNVKIAVTGNASGFVVTGSAVAGCSGATGTWSFDSAIGRITGTACN